MALSIIFACEGLRTNGARMLFGFIMRCQMALHVFRISKSLLAYWTPVGVHLGFVVSLSVVPTALSVESHLWISWSSYLRPDVEGKVLLQGKQTWRVIASALLEESTLAATAEDPDPPFAVDLDGIWKPEVLRCAD